jgi:hypothetical protein
MAIEPFSSIPGQGLVTAMEKTGSHRTLATGDSIAAELRAVFYESTTGIEHIEADGRLVLLGAVLLHISAAYQRTRIDLASRRRPVSRRGVWGIGYMTRRRRSRHAEQRQLH